MRGHFLLHNYVCSMADLTGAVNATYGGDMQQTRWFFLVGLILIGNQLVDWAMQYFWPSVVLVNHQAFFGLLNRPWAIALLLVLAAVVLWRLRSVIGENTLLAVALGLIVAGGLSNVLDRLIYGGVIDYVPVAGWFTFNVADVEISLGTALFIWREVSRQNPQG